METIKEITIKEIDAAYETLERVIGRDCMKGTEERLWQNFSGQAAGATMTGTEILRKMGDEASIKEVCDHYSNVIVPKFEKLYHKIIGLEEA